MTPLPPADTPAACTVLDAAWQPDPYPFYRALAERHRADGLYHDADAGLWVACTPAAVRAVLQAQGLCVRPADEPVPRALQGRPCGALFGGLMRMNEGPQRHARPKADAQARLATLPAGVPHAVSAALALGLVPGAHPLDDLLVEAPLATLTLLLGQPPADARTIAQQVRALVAAWAPGAPEPVLAAGDAAATALLARFHGDANRVGLLTQACDATAGLLGNALVAWQRDPALDASAAVQRGVRDDPAVHNTRRYAHADLQCAGQPLRAGDSVLVLLVTSAGRGFGLGRHACPGEALAQQVATELLQRWRALDAPLLRSLSAQWHYRRLPNARIPLFAPWRPA
jgi:unspecific monooxygenase